MPWPESRDAGRPRDGVTGAAGRGGSRRLVVDLPALLTVMGCQTAAELDLMLYGAFELDPCVLEATAEHVLVVIRDRGVAVPFPFTVDQFWEAVTGLEDEVMERLEDASDGEE